MIETTSILRLTIPKIEASAAPPEMNADQIGSWLSTLPMANVKQSASDIQDVLVLLNRAPMPIEQRYRIMELIARRASDVDAAMKKLREKTAFRPSERNRELAALHQSMLRELAMGYKRILVELLQTGEPGRVPRAMVIAMHRTIHFLSQELIEAYVAYATEPAKIWGEIHRIYRFAAQARIHNQEIPVGRGNAGESESIEKVYLQIVLLYLTNPYHLMQGEVYTIFELLPEWLSDCKMSPVATGTEIAGQLYIDPEHDEPPRYAPLEMPAKPLKALRIDLTDLAARVGQVVDKIEQQRRANNALTLIERMNRDMLLRLKAAWTTRRERVSPRSPQMVKIEVVVGLSGTQHFVGGEAKFEPEHHEHELGDRFSGTMEVMGDTDDWGSSASTMRSSIFESTDVGGADHWDDVFSTPEKEAIARRVHEESYRQQFATSHWDQHDISEGGISISCGDQLPDTVRVGEIVGYRDDAGDGDWNVGSVRWMQFLPGRGLSLGIRKLSSGAHAVAARAISGTGKGGEYFRAIATASLESSPESNSLLVPAAIYDIGTLVLITTPTKLYYLRLVELLETSRSYTRFSFELSEPPKEKFQSHARANKLF